MSITNKNNLRAYFYGREITSSFAANSFFVRIVHDIIDYKMKLVANNNLRQREREVGWLYVYV